MVWSLPRCLQRIAATAPSKAAKVRTSKTSSRSISYYPLGSLKLGYPALKLENRIAVVGTGLTGMWAIRYLCRELQNTGFGNRFKIDVYGKENWATAGKKTAANASTVFKDEASAISPMGIQFQQGSFPWNDKEAVGLVQNGIGNPNAAFYVAPNLPEEDRKLLRLYTEWDGRHPDPEDPASTVRRQASLVRINRFADKMWEQFRQEHKFKAVNPIDLTMEGAYRLYNDVDQYSNALRSNAILKQCGYGAEAVSDPEELARQIPFFWTKIVSERLRGISFRQEGLVDSGKLRDFLKADVMKNEPWKPKVEFHFDAGVRELKTSASQDCEGVVLEDNRIQYADMVVLAAGMGNSRILAQHNIQLPLMRVWGAAMRAKLNENAFVPPRGGVSFHNLRCISGSPDGKTMTIAGTSMVVPSNEIPHPSLYMDKMRRNFELICGSDVDFDTLQTVVGGRILTADDKPVISLTGRLAVLNPTYHLGNTQGPALGRIAGMYASHLYRLLPKEKPIAGFDLDDYRLNRFTDDMTRTVNEPPVLKFDETK